MTDFNDEIALLFPAYLRGELSSADVERVDAAVAKNLELGADLEFQRQLRTTLQSGNTGRTSDDLGWARLSKAMDAAEAEDIPTLNAVPVSDAANDSSAPRSKFWMGATAALALLAVGQFGVLATQSNDNQDKAQYRLVTETAAKTQAKIAPLPELRVEDLNDILTSTGGQVVNGPSAIGLYDIQFETKDACGAAVSKFQTHIENTMTCR